jgi:hypothetical protein
MSTCEQCAKAPATVYAMGPYAGDWGGRYCAPCADRLNTGAWNGGATITPLLKEN